LPSTPPVSELSADNEVALELALWDSVKDGSPAELESYLEQYPEGTFALIAGSPATVRDRLREEVVRELRVGNLMVLLQIGSMPHELALENIDLFARKVLPEFRDEWNDDGWVNYWWPEQLRDRVGESVPAAVGPQ
jgi:alkanesulfonate monooxygenase SsuD/methylene tetrahydromethanopterin reductase-like flavin-dependent oxidoreductase (luciferase family)